MTTLLEICSYRAPTNPYNAAMLEITHHEFETRDALIGIKLLRNPLSAETPRVSEAIREIPDFCVFKLPAILRLSGRLTSLRY